MLAMVGFVEQAEYLLWWYKKIQR